MKAKSGELPVDSAIDGLIICVDIINCWVDEDWDSNWVAGVTVGPLTDTLSGLENITIS